MKRYEISPQQWEQIKDLFSDNKGKRGRPLRSHYEIFNGILWVLFSGASWRDVPEWYGSWQTVYDRYSKWKKDGTFDKVLSHLKLKLDKQGLLDYSKWMVDSTTSRAHKSAAGGSKKSPSEPADHGLGRSRGGFSSKIHLVCDANGNPLSAVVGAGHRHDAAFFEEVLDSVSVPQQKGRPRTKSEVVIADKGYDGSPIRNYLSKRAIRAVIPPKELKEGSVRKKRTASTIG